MSLVDEIYRTRLHQLYRKAARVAVTRRDMLSTLDTMRPDMSKQRYAVLHRTITACPRSEWTDVIQRQPEFNQLKSQPVGREQPRKTGGTEAQIAAHAKRYCPVCGVYCTNRHKEITNLDGQWYHVTCLDNLTN